jgi:hypothetical protein
MASIPAQRNRPVGFDIERLPMLDLEHSPMWDRWAEAKQETGLFYLTSGEGVSRRSRVADLFSWLARNSKRGRGLMAA